MAKNSMKESERREKYLVDSLYRGVRVGTAIGFVFGALLYFLFSSWLSEEFFYPIVLVTAVIFAVVFSRLFPAMLSHRDFDDDPDNITPAERVKGYPAEQKSRNKEDTAKRQN